VSDADRWYADETGWAWFIPLHDGTTSVGVVQNKEALKAKKAAAKASDYESTSLTQYFSDLKLAPNLGRLLQGAELVKKVDSPLLSSASDFSYTADSYAGPGWRAVGDAGCK
jgi:flavine halogenase